MAESRDDTMNCPVCFELYREGGDNIPRLLPCTHTVCEKCVLDLMQDAGTLECPECREKHQATDGAQTFHQNKYILAHIRRNGGVSVEECPVHHKEKSLYCKNSHCQKAVCQVCMVKHHRAHEVVDIKEEQKEKYRNIESCVDAVVGEIAKNKNKPVKVGEELESHNQACFRNLKDIKTISWKRFLRDLMSLSNRIPTK